MFKRFFGILLGRAPFSTSKPSGKSWREPPIKTIRDEIGAGLVSEISYPIGHHGFVNVVGELSYQETLRDLPEFFTAKLVPEPNNPYDSNAVAVKTDDDRTIGYLARGVAKSYQPKLVQHQRPITCPAKLTGGRGYKAHIGVVLDFEEVRQSLGLPIVAVDPGPIDYDAVAEYHRVNNAARELVNASRPLEGNDPAAAEAQYRRAVAMIRKCHTLATSRGLIAHGFLPNQTDTVALERLVLCLIKLGRVQDAKHEIEAYCEMFPHARQMKLLATIRARVEKRKRFG